MVELNSKSLGALKRLADDSILSDADFGEFIATIFDTYTVNINTGKFEIDAESKSASSLEALWRSKTSKKSMLELKEIVAATHMLIAELARHNADKTSAG